MAVRPFDSATVVLGMHRSGTSALAGALHLCGLSVPDEVIEASATNEKGFWEPAAVKKLDDEILGRLDRTWYSLLPLNFTDLGKRATDQFRKTASGILKSEYPKNTDIVLKEPRLCLLAPLWKPVFHELANATAYVLIIRNPVEVARSLTKRNGFDLNHGLLLWARYSLDAEFHTRGERRAVVSYADLVDEVGATVKRLAEKAHIPIETDRPRLRAVEQFLAPDLRHHRESDRESLTGKPAEVAEAYAILRGWSEGQPESQSDYEKLDGLRDQLDRMTVAIADVFEEARRDRKRWVDARAQIQENTSTLAGLQQSLERSLEIKKVVEENSQSLSSIRSATGESLKKLDERVAESFAATEERLGVVTTEVSRVAETLGDAQSRAFGSVERSLDALNDAVTQGRASDRKIEVAVSTMAAEQGALLADVRAKLADAAETDRQRAAQLAELSTNLDQALEEQSLRLCDLSAEIKQRVELEEALTQSVRTAADLSARLERAELAAAVAAAEFARLNGENEAGHQATVKELEEKAEALKAQQARADELDAELQRTKRKYRAAQWDVERESRAHRATRSRLVAAEATVARFKSSLLWRSYLDLAGPISTLSEILKGRSRTAKKRRSEQLQVIANSGLFDRDWYLAHYPDVEAAGVDPLEHFFDLGWREGRDPGPAFATSSYLKANPDVARAQGNPLLHYIEFGRSEGREAPPHRGPRQTSPAVTEEFSAPAPVFRGDASKRRPLFWTRSYRLAQGDPRLVTAGTLLVGYAAAAEDRCTTEDAFERLANLSGLTAPSAQAETGVGRASAVLIDAWYTSRAELRTRWRDESGSVIVRAYQHDPRQDGRLVLLGEGLLASELDVLDCSLANPYLPLLFVFSSGDGIIAGTRLMPFPSLCRGGLHYPELVAGAVDAVDPIQAGEIEAGRLIAARRSPDRLLDSINVDFTGSDGSSPFEDSAFCEWLRSVAQIEIARFEPEAKDAADAATGSRLILSYEMIPAISILGQRGEAVDQSRRAVVLPLLIAGDEPSQPATLVELPRIASAILGARATAFSATWPWFVPGSAGRVPSSSSPAAIRLPKARVLTDSDLLAPCPGTALDFAKESSAGITWLITARDWQSVDLIQALRALSLQSGAASQVIGFVGEVDLLSRTVAQELFGERVRYFADLHAASENIDTALAGHVGPGVVLHDSRSASVLAALLSDPATVSASCTLVRTEKRGKGWHSSAVDGGAITLDLGSGKTIPGRAHEAALPWRASFPVSRPPRDLWVARSPAVKSWLASGATEPLRKGMHVCTSLLTASYVSAPAEQVEELPLPSVTAGLSTKARALFG